MDCPNCENDLMRCFCPDAPEQIERLLAKDRGKMDKSTYNRLAWRAAELMEPRIEANEREFFARFRDLRRFPARKRMTLKPKG